ncbi:hypothetical protein F3Y22_tig00110893pilonHSYRG00595 [Hibiscus syriacus]|uniref:Anther-specific protein BCP1 n=1 Tax=Hibiscus syriacus TaxID=106335 RepID=A0A6A2ZI63_HIBSY|nr:classical arabinogalactan protein 11-like [Hibiscus syriacus]KAE8690832.1 hypothetical protein F3Y22_tig00110893pilonHSYRG00595 [Hibiscus syriacus]
MARQIVVVAAALVLIALVGSVSAASPASKPTSGDSPAPAPGGATSIGAAAGGSPSSLASAPGPSSDATAALDVLAIGGVGVAVVAGYFLF